MSGRPMFIVTQVAPYPDGPAGVHGVLVQASCALAELAGLSGLEPRAVSDVSELAPSELGGGGVLCLFTIGETPWSDPQRSAITDSVRDGRLGVLAVHSATDACRDWEEYTSVVGGRFDGHPWTQEFLIDVVDGEHPSTEHLGEQWKWRDEVYTFCDLRPDVRVLLTVAPGQLDMDAPGAHVPEAGFPLAWCFTEGHGRAFYTSLGHFPSAWETPRYLRHVAGGLSWVLGGAAR
ncbi:MAG: ThuA domain-containing protein [Acidimicrobiales bacterium]